MDGIRNEGLGLDRRLADFQALKEAAEKRISGSGGEERLLNARRGESVTKAFELAQPAPALSAESMAQAVNGTLKKVNELLLYHQDSKPKVSANATQTLGNYIDRMA